MSTNTDFDRRTAAWLADGPIELSDRVLDAALREVHMTSQRRRWSTSWRINPMLNNTRLLAAIAIVAVVGAGALFYVNRSPGVGAPPSPSPTATAHADFGRSGDHGLEDLHLRRVRVRRRLPGRLDRLSVGDARSGKPATA